AVSGATGNPTDAAIIAAIVLLSVGLGFVNEYRSERAVAALHANIQHQAVVQRDGKQQRIDVRDLVPGDVLSVGIGDLTSADVKVGLKDFSRLLVLVAGILAVSIFVITVAFARPIIDALLFSLAIAIGITPQLLPAIVSVSLATGSRELARRKVLVKRLVTIEDLGNIEVLFTDKTGTLTEGAITFDRSLDAAGRPAEGPLLLGLICNEATM